jgi:hypothetical protein
MLFNDGYTEIHEIGAETLADLERRAGVSIHALLDSIVRSRVRYPDSDASHLSHSLNCNNPSIKATGQLKKYEETKAYKMLVMLAEFRDGMEERFSLRHAYRKANVSRNSMQEWRKEHPLFDALIDSIQDEMVDTMRAEAYRRSVVGVDEPIFYQGADTGHRVKKYSDSLLQFTLMGYDSRFRAKDVNMNVSGSLDTNVNVEGLRDRLAQRLKSKSKTQEEQDS